MIILVNESVKTPEAGYRIRFQTDENTGFVESEVFVNAVSDGLTLPDVHQRTELSVDDVAELAMRALKAGSYPESDEDTVHIATELTVTSQELKAAAFMLELYANERESDAARIRLATPLNKRAPAVRIVEGCMAQTMAKQIVAVTGNHDFLPSEDTKITGFQPNSPAS